MSEAGGPPGHRLGVTVSTPDAVAAWAGNCPLTGRQGVWTSHRSARPQPPGVRRELAVAPSDCPFCEVPTDDPRLLDVEVVGTTGRWFGLRNIYPPLAGAIGEAVLAVGERHDPTLAHLGPGCRADWAAVLELQLRLARRWPSRWALLTVAVGSSAGASQHHPHGQVLMPSVAPALTVEQQRRLRDPAVLAELRSERRVVEQRDGLLLLAPPVALGPLDLLLLPVDPGPLDSLPYRSVAGLVVDWLAGVHEALALEPTVDGPAPVDVKVLIYAPLPGEPGRWWAELQVTEAHAPGVAAAPLVDLAVPPDEHARLLREAVRRADRPA